MSKRTVIILKILVWLACLGPLSAAAYRVATQTLPPNPIEYITLLTGQSTIILLMVTLAVTPVRKLTGQNWLIKFRRLLGLFAFFYACLHFLTYIWLDQFFDLHSIWRDIFKRPFITVGFLAFVLLIPLAVTSTAGWIRRLGGKRWNLLHKLIYVSAMAGVVHFWWKVKADHRQPALYGGIVLVLLGYRVLAPMFKRQPMRPAPVPTIEAQ